MNSNSEISVIEILQFITMPHSFMGPPCLILWLALRQLNSRETVQELVKVVIIRLWYP